MFCKIGPFFHTKLPPWLALSLGKTVFVFRNPSVLPLNFTKFVTRQAGENTSKGRALIFRCVAIMHVCEVWKELLRGSEYLLIIVACPPPPPPPPPPQSKITMETTFTSYTQISASRWRKEFFFSLERESFFFKADIIWLLILFKN